MKIIKFFIISVLFFTIACNSEVGDECSTSSDCSTSSGNLTCETTLPGGYCTIPNCNEDSCPDGSICIAFYSISSLTNSCAPSKEDTSENNCDLNEICLQYGQCADPLTASSYCMKKCNDDSDCRDGYSCIQTGTYPDEPVTSTYPHKIFKYCGIK